MIVYQFNCHLSLGPSINNVSSEGEGGGPPSKPIYYISLYSNLSRQGEGVINLGKWANVVYGWPIIGSDTSSVASRARTKLTSSKCDWTRIWTIYNIDETTPRVLKFFHFICTNWWQQTHAGLGTLTGYTFIWDWDLNLGCKELRI